MSKDLDEDLVRRLAGLLDETGLGELEYETDDWRIRVAKPGVGASVVAATAPAPAAVSAPAAVASESSPASAAVDANAVTSPMVGTAFLAPDPDATAFAPVGANVRKGDTLMIIEAMKVMNTITAPKDGKVSAVLVENNQPVEFGQPLIVIE